MTQDSLKKIPKTVLVGGCFDVLHPGHVIFLEKAKKAGDRLIVLLESDEKIKKIKGSGRPIHTQKERAIVLKALKFVDSVVMLPFIDKDEDYDGIIKKIQPNIIAATKGAADNYHKQRIARLIGAKLKYVTKVIGNHSTSQILNSRG